MALRNMPIERPETRLNSGSLWHRWDPHIHAPGTILNDQFSGDRKWEDYLDALEAADPPIRALGITDYYSIATYEAVCASKAKGRLPHCQLIFPNIELRLAIGTVKGRWVNIHLLVSPEDSDHVAQIQRILSNLSFKAHEEVFKCTQDDLIRLGKKIDPAKPDAALEIGARNFKVSLDDLREVFNNSAWARCNICIAISGNSNDGTSGVSDAADTALRQEIDKFADIIFASSLQQREYWLGRGTLGRNEFLDRYRNLKPCLHGSDAHKLDDVGAPAENRYTWIKGAVHFDTLRQCCIDPEGRAYVGSTPPVIASPSQVISAIEIVDAPWAKSPRLLLNPGLVTIIGARGSGKTALVDMLALGCDAMPHQTNEASFLSRAGDLLIDQSVRLEWQAGDPIERSLTGINFEAEDYPRARYLSQKFVEDLCSARGMTDSLLSEIERVIFESHSLAERDGTMAFDELVSLRADRFREARSRGEENLANLSDEIGTELEKQNQISPLTKQVEDKKKQIQRLNLDRGKFAVKGNEKRVERLATLSAAAEKIRGYVQFFHSQEQKLLALKDEVENLRTHQAPDALRTTQQKYKDTRLKPEEWSAFLLDYTGDVDQTLTDRIAEAQKNAKEWKGTPPTNADPTEPYIADEAELENETLAKLDAEIERIKKLVSVDQQTIAKLTAILRTIAQEQVALQRLEEKLKDAQAAPERKKILVQERQDAYTRVFEAVIAEQDVLIELYKPLMSRLEVEKGTLNKLSFQVKRVADVTTWAANGESLLDLRRRGPLKGAGSLLQSAEKILRSSWENGTAQEVSTAMTAFRNESEPTFLEQARQGDPATFREWSKEFAKWLYGTSHVSIEYSINYDSVDIRKLSPGTRGIVLLMLYLALDDQDDRPLIIDQPEENLDPKSIYDELVELFMQAKSKRQVIMVTHNANLVVNTDADQIIIAEVGSSAPGNLPPITYTSGGLEDQSIRAKVCDILEGGERAFIERARRLRVTLK
jgi:ABC-type dipeptide/oligopeptide/nickel transport system ATPase component